MGNPHVARRSHRDQGECLFSLALASIVGLRFRNVVIEHLGDQYFLLVGA